MENILVKSASSNIVTSSKAGFTLLEVLIAMSILAIALIALVQSTGRNIQTAQRVNNRLVAHWVEMQAIHLIQLHMIPINEQIETTHSIKFLGSTWYWKAYLKSSPIDQTKEIHVSVNETPSGSFRYHLVGYLRD